MNSLYIMKFIFEDNSGETHCHNLFVLNHNKFLLTFKKFEDISD